ncbi:MAG: response regulator transcription factor [Thermodesulfovibrionales bacterium]
MQPRSSSAPKLNVLLLIGNKLYGEAIKSLLSEEKESFARFAVYCGRTLRGQKPDFVVADDKIMDQRLFLRYPEAKVLVVDNGLSPEDIRFIAAQFKINGVISSQAGTANFRRALETIHNGEFWLEPEMIGRLIHNDTAKLQTVRSMIASEREKVIIDYVLAGYANREIAAQLQLSEHTVKAHLNNIYRKFRISSRIQLVMRFSTKMK